MPKEPNKHFSYNMGELRFSLWQDPVSSGRPKPVYFLEYAENTVFCAAQTLLWEKIQRDCALCVVGTHCSGKCQLVLLLD